MSTKDHTPWRALVVLRGRCLRAVARKSPPKPTPRLRCDGRPTLSKIHIQPDVIELEVMILRQGSPDADFIIPCEAAREWGHRDPFANLRLVALYLHPSFQSRLASDSSFSMSAPAATMNLKAK